MTTENIVLALCSFESQEGKNYETGKNGHKTWAQIQGKVSLCAQLVRQPVKPFIQAGTIRSAARLNKPLPALKVGQSKSANNFSGGRGVGKVLFVSEDEYVCVAQLLLSHHFLEFVACLVETITIIGIHDEYDALCVLEVVTPQRTDLVLPADVPYGEVDVLVRHRLHIEADGGDGRYYLAKLQLVQNGRLTRGVKSNLAGCVAGA